MAAVIRVKRRINEEPFDKFVLNCKRRRTSDDECSSNVVTPNQLETSDETTTILKFTGTIQTEDDLKTHITRLTKSKAEESVRKTRKIVNVTTKNREQLKANAQNSRFKVINCFRSVSNDGDGADGGSLTIVDVIKDDTTETNDEIPKTDPATDEANTMVTMMETDFVYDLYMVDDEQNTQIDYETMISIRPFDDLVYQVNDDTYADSDNNSEDSNDEDNWRNEYPDTDNEFSVGEEDMRRAVEELNFGSDDNLSSDESDYDREPVVHFLDADDDLSAFDYFKKYGRVKSHKQYYRTTQRGRDVAASHDADSDSGTKSSNDASVHSDDE